MSGTHSCACSLCPKSSKKSLIPIDSGRAWSPQAPSVIRANGEEEEMEDAARKKKEAEDRKRKDKERERQWQWEERALTGAEHEAS